MSDDKRDPPELEPEPKTQPPRRSASWPLPDPDAAQAPAVIEAPDEDAEYKILVENAPSELKGSLRVQFDMIIELRKLIERLGETHRGVNKLAAGSLKLGAAGQQMAASVDGLTATVSMAHEEVQAARADISASQGKVLGALAELLRQFSHVLDKNAKALQDCVDNRLREHVAEHHSDPTSIPPDVPEWPDPGTGRKP